MIVLGIWSCQWRELRPIFFGGKEGQSQTTHATAAGTDGPGAQGAAEEAIGLLTRGRSRTRGEDAGPSFEMASAPQARG